MAAGLRHAGRREPGDCHPAAVFAAIGRRPVTDPDQLVLYAATFLASHFSVNRADLAVPPAGRERLPAGARAVAFPAACWRSARLGLEAIVAQPGAVPKRFEK